MHMSIFLCLSNNTITQEQLDIMKFECNTVYKNISYEIDNEHGTKKVKVTA